MDEEEYQKVRDYALRLLSFRPRSTNEISTKLKKYCSKRKFPDKLIAQLIEEFTEQKLLDDKAFIRWWLEQRQSYKPKGVRAIKIELINKGVDKKLIDETVSEIKERISEYDLAMQVITRKLIHLKHLSSEKLKIKIRDLLLRRGFDWDVIYKVIDSTFKKA